jgi:hypothetical protein
MIGQNLDGYDEVRACIFGAPHLALPATPIAERIS